MPRYIGHFELGQLLGSGGFGKVYYGRDTKTDEEVAVKMIDKNLIKLNNMEEYVDREIAIMKRLQHQHVIGLKGVVELPSSYCLIMELANNGELFDKILDAKRFDEKTARAYFQQLISAVAYCHSKGVVHRDLKAENLLLGHGGSLKVCDFGLSRYTMGRNGTPDNSIVFMSLAGSPDYQAPEMTTTSMGYHGESCDVWSCGVILYFMLCGYLPFQGADDEDTVHRATIGKFRVDDRYLKPSALDLISKILTQDPERRITVNGIIQHPWFQVDLDRTLIPDTPKGDVMASPLQPGVPGFVTEAKERCGDSIVATLHKAFHSCNVDRSGHLKKSEIRDVLIVLNNGSPVADEEVLGVMECFNKDEDGTISEEEFVQGWAVAETRMGNKLPLAKLVNIFHYDLENRVIEDLRKAFDKLDVNHNGVLTAVNVMSIDELKLNDDEAAQLIEAMDSRKSGTVTFSDFVGAMMSADLLRCSPYGAKLQRVRELFDAVDRTSFTSYLNTGFLVAGFREQIMHKLVNESQCPEFCTEFSVGEAAFLHGLHTDAQSRRLQVGVQLLPAAVGYTKVLAYRISGKTEVFHLWFSKFRGFLHSEIVRCAEDTSVKGDSQLL